MILRLIQIGNALPLSYPVDSTSSFDSGHIGQLYLMGNNIVCGLSDGSAPLGIIDDVRTTAFFAPSIDEVKIQPVVGQLIGGKYLSVTDVVVLLDHSNIQTNSFICDTEIYLRETNGAVIIPAGTELNYNLTGGPTPDAIRIVCSYSYQVPGIAGDDSTAGATRITIHFQRGIYATNIYEVGQSYPLSANLFVSENGVLTTRQQTPYHPTVGIVTGPPTSSATTLEFMWV